MQKGEAHDGTREDGSGLLSIEARKRKSRDGRGRGRVVETAEARVGGKQTSLSLSILVTVGRNCEYRISLGSPSAANSSPGNRIPGKSDGRRANRAIGGGDGGGREERDSEH